MSHRFNQDVILGLVAFALGIAIILFWAPLGSDSGIAEKIRGRWSIGDALAPTVAGVSILLAGLWLAISGAVSASAKPGLNAANTRYLLGLFAILLISLTIMRYAGPALVAITGGEYRLLRDTVPFKYIGFVLGGGGMIFALMSLIEGAITAKRLALGMAIALGLALAYDLPFEDLLLPPNGDV
ncbi:MAG: hypothetical protein ACPGGK_07040 [Pikeienuella sp.]